MQREFIGWRLRGMEYSEFLKRKVITVKESGFDCKQVNPILYEFQQDITKWALKKGCAALFEDCGLGKTFQQLEWAKQVVAHTNGKVLILAPLAVSLQTKREGAKLGIDVNVCRTQKDVINGINITNYEMIEHFNTDDFTGIVLDESSILKAFMGKTKRLLVDSFKDTPYKLCCTATPAPNDHMELLNHAEFLGIMKSSEALSIWFINDTKNSGTYRLKGHAIKSFWEWVSSWAVCLENPNSLGYNIDGFNLPKLNTIEHIIKTDEIDYSLNDGFLRKIDTSATAFHKEKRFTAENRANKSAEIVHSNNEQYVIWCNTDYEADCLKKVIPEAVDVRGSNSIEFKEQSAINFINGDIRVLISKSKIFGFGLNFQNCFNTIFCGLDYSYESYYQAVRRFWRYGQKNEVNCNIVLGSTEKHILETIRRKEEQQKEMHKEMYKNIVDIQKRTFRGQKFKLSLETQEITVPNWLRSEYGICNR